MRKLGKIFHFLHFFVLNVYPVEIISVASAAYGITFELNLTIKRGRTKGLITVLRFTAPRAIGVIKVASESLCALYVAGLAALFDEVSDTVILQAIVCGRLTHTGRRL